MPAIPSVLLEPPVQYYGAIIRGDSIRGVAAVKRIAILAAVAAALLVGVFMWVKLGPRHVPEGQPPLVTLGTGSLPAFRDEFNAAQGNVRILALLSPT
jgi:hypothetical protein